MDKIQQTIDYQEAFGTPGGKRILENLKRLSHYNTAYVPRGVDGYIDSHEMCREEGKRAVIVHIEMILKRDPNKVKGIVNE